MWAKDCKMIGNTSLAKLRTTSRWQLNKANFKPYKLYSMILQNPSKERRDCNCSRERLFKIKNIPLGEYKNNLSVEHEIFL